MTKIKENNTCNTNNNNDGNKKRIMIVDDEPDVISVLKIVLEENGFEVDSFIDPIAALKNYRTSLYDLLILDIKMPKMASKAGVIIFRPHPPIQHNPCAFQK
jgi:DNA-binding response OmpR family regulator